MSKHQPVNFSDVIKEVQSSQVGKESLSIWGGRVPEMELRDFLSAWEKLAQMPYRIWEYVSEIHFEMNSMSNEPALLQRGRLFGGGGDMELRRDGHEFIWRFIGPAGVEPPEGSYDAESYWNAHDDETFHCYEEAALLWGQWDGSRWVDDRVSAATLEYPAAGKRVKLEYKSYSRAGHVAFVWFTGLSEWKEDNDG